MSSESDKPSDRRRSKRVPMSVALSGKDPRTTTPVSDLSEHGVFVHTDDLLPVGSRIELRFTVFPEEPVLFEGVGQVRHHSSEPRGMGVEFLELDDSAKDVVRKIMLRAEAERQRKPHGYSDESLRTHGLVARLLDEPE